MKVKKILIKNLIIVLIFSSQVVSAQYYTTTSGSWFSASTWANGNAPGTSVNTSTRIVNPVVLDGTGGTINLLTQSNINSIINAPITDVSSGGWDITFSNNGNNYLQINSTFYIKNDFNIAGGVPTTFSGNGYIGGTLTMSNSGGISLRIKSGYSVTVGGLNIQGGALYIEPGASLIVLGNATINNNGGAGIIVDGALVVNGFLNVQGGIGVTGTGSLTTPNPITIANNGGANVFGQTNSSTGGSISCSSASPCNLSTNTVCSGVTVVIGSDQSLCSGGSAAQVSTIAGTFITGTVTYQWMQYTGSSNSYQNVASGGNTTQYSPGILTAQTFYKLKVTKSGCTTYSNYVTINVSSTPVNGNGNITGTNPVCRGMGATFTANGITGATSYNWTLPSGFTLASSSGSTAAVNVANNASQGIISVTGSNACGRSSVITFSVTTINSLPGTLGSIVGSVSLCQGTTSGNTFSISGVSLASTYNWTLPSGISIASSNTAGNVIALTLSASAVSGSIAVSAQNACGNTTPVSKALTVNPLPNDAGSIMGSTVVCANTSGLVYSISGITNAISYKWVNSNTSFVINSVTSTTSISMTSQNGNNKLNTVSVFGINTCGTGVGSNLSMTTTNQAAAISNILGVSPVCQNSSNTYTATGANIGIYNWSVPSGFVIISTNGTNSPSITISVSGTAISKSISVSGVGCGTSPVVSTLIGINSVPGAAGSIIGTSSLCGGQTVNYSVAGISGATGYYWAASAPSFSLSGTGNNSITADVPNINGIGYISVVGSNTCGQGAVSIKTVTVTSVPTAGSISGGSSICINQTGLTFTATGFSGATGYGWTVPSGLTVSSGNGTNKVSLSSGTSSTSFPISVTGTNSCGKSAVVTFSLGYGTTWLGVTSDWNNAQNWCNGAIPTAATDIYIQVGAAKMPILTTSGASVRNITIGTGASFTLSGINQLAILGNWSNVGTLVPSTLSSINFNGTSVQSISGTTNFYNIQVNNSVGGVYFTSNQSVSGTLTLGNNAILNTNDKLIIISNANGTGRIGILPTSAVINGNISVQRYLPAKRAVRFFSSPVNNATFNQLKSYIYLTGSGGTTNGFDASPYNIPTIYQYVESVPGMQNKGTTEIASTALTFQQGVGYQITMRGDRTTGNYSGISNITTTSVVVQLTGSVNRGDIPLPVSFTPSSVSSADGWNLVGNPYPSQIDWDNTLTGWNSSNISNSIYIWDPGTTNTTVTTNSGVYYTYTRGLGCVPARTPCNGIIANSQAFFVKATAATPSITIHEQAKVGNSSYNSFFRQQAPVNKIRIRVEGANVADEALISLGANYSAAFEPANDVDKLSNPILNITSLSAEGRPLVINATTVPDTMSSVIPVAVSSTKKGNYSLSFSLSDFENPLELALKDKYLNTSTPVNEALVYPFEISSVSGSSVNRFEITLKRLKAPIQTINSVNGADLDPLPAADSSAFIDEEAFNNNISQNPLSSLTGSDIEVVEIIEVSVTGNNIEVVQEITQVTIAGNHLGKDHETEVTTGISHVSSVPSVSVYPNPLRDDVLKIEIISAYNEHVSLTIYDLRGGRIHHEVYFISGHDNIISLHGIHLNPGAYFIDVNGNNWNQKFKLVKINH